MICRYVWRRDEGGRGDTADGGSVPFRWREGGRLAGERMLLCKKGTQLE